MEKSIANINLSFLTRVPQLVGSTKHFLEQQKLHIDPRCKSLRVLQGELALVDASTDELIIGSTQATTCVIGDLPNSTPQESGENSPAPALLLAIIQAKYHTCRFMTGTADPRHSCM